MPSDLESSVLESGRSKVKPAIPEPRFFGRRSAIQRLHEDQGEHWTAEAYARRDESTKARLASDIAAFLWGVHGAVAASEFVSMGLRREDWRPRLARELAVLDAVQIRGLPELGVRWRHTRR